MKSLKLDLLMYFFLNSIDSFFTMNKSLRCENSNEARSSFANLLFITSVVQSVILVLLICGLINDYFSVVFFVSQSYFNENKRLPLQTIRS